MLDAQACGKVDARLFEARSILVAEDSVDHASGRVLDRALDRRLRDTSLVNVDQEGGRGPVIELPSKESDVSDVIHRTSDGRGTPVRLM